MRQFLKWRPGLGHVSNIVANPIVGQSFKVYLCCFCQNALHVVYIPTKYYQNISKGIEAIECSRFLI